MSRFRVRISSEPPYGAIVKRYKTVDFQSTDEVSTTSGATNKIKYNFINLNPDFCIFEPQIPDIILLSSAASDSSTDMGKMRREAERRGQAWFQIKGSIY